MTAKGAEVGREPRALAAGAIYHVMARGNDHQTVFFDDSHRKSFLTILSGVVVQRSWTLLAYCLMGNHFHLVVRTEEADLSDGMREALSRYARAFNLARGRSGRLFTDRYRSIVIESDQQLLATLRYVARNPVQAGLSRCAGEWRWESYTAVLTGEAISVLDVDALLGLFHPLPGRALSLFRALVEGCDGDRDPGAASLEHTEAGRRPSLATLVLLMGIDGAVAAAVRLGYRQREIADTLGLSQSLVSKRLRRRVARGSAGMGVGDREPGRPSGLEC